MVDHRFLCACSCQQRKSSELTSIMPFSTALPKMLSSAKPSIDFGKRDKHRNAKLVCSCESWKSNDIIAKKQERVMTLPFLPAHHHQMGPSLYLWIWTPWCQAFSLLFPRARILWHLLLPILLLVQNLRFWLLLPTQVVVLLLPRPPVLWHLPLPILLLVQNLRFGFFFRLRLLFFFSGPPVLWHLPSDFASGSESSVSASSSDSGFCSSYLGLRFFGICLFRFCFWFRIFSFGFLLIDR